MEIAGRLLMLRVPCTRWFSRPCGHEVLVGFLPPISSNTPPHFGR
jgi:hypothetical protein